MITDTQARKIASSWHGGGGTALYAFASTGAIDTARADHDIKAEIQAEINDRYQNEPDDDTSERDELHALWTYVNHHGPRGPVAGWSTLTW